MGEPAPHYNVLVSWEIPEIVERLAALLQEREGFDAMQFAHLPLNEATQMLVQCLRQWGISVTLEDEGTGANVGAEGAHREEEG